MKEVIAFLRELHDHNDRAWFDANRQRWESVREEFRTFTEGLIDGIASFDPSVKGLRPQDCTYRIARDTRFSADKSPYKTYIGAFVAPHGKKAGYAGYYFHIEPVGDRLLSGSGLTAGVYCPEPVVLRSIRDEILDNGAEVAAAMEQASGFRLNTENCLRRTPTGYPRGTEYDALLRQKDLYVTRPVDDAYLLAPHLLERVVEEFQRTQHLVEILNRAVQFAYDEMR